MSDKQYGYLTTITWSGIVNVSRIVLGYHVSHNWHTQLIHKDKLIITTDQDIALETMHTEQKLSRFKEVHFNGTTIYKDWKFWRGWL